MICNGWPRRSINWRKQERDAVMLLIIDPTSGAANRGLLWPRRTTTLFSAPTQTDIYISRVGTTLPMTLAVLFLPPVETGGFDASYSLPTHLAIRRGKWWSGGFKFRLPLSSLGGTGTGTGTGTETLADPLILQPASHGLGERASGALL